MKALILWPRLMDPETLQAYLGGRRAAVKLLINDYGLKPTMQGESRLTLYDKAVVDAAVDRASASAGCWTAG